MVTLYGIKNCDTVKKTRKWLEQHAVEYRFHDFRGDGLERDQLTRFAETAGWETLLNRRGTSWRKLDAADRENVDAAKAVELMLTTPTLIKRPVLDTGEQIIVGFNIDTYQQLFG